MVKCWAVVFNSHHQKPVKCNRQLVACLLSRGQHSGRRFLGVKTGKFLNVSWSDPSEPDVSTLEGQRKLAAEIRRLRFQRLDASNMKQPRMYANITRKLESLAQFVV